MSAINLQEAQARLPEIIGQLLPGEEITIIDHGEPLAQVKRAERTSWPCKPGSAAGRVWMAADFDAPIEDFPEYEE
jgi:antitoxin (DNA-binding transcriptional repressor) of toxin-antitoxin stability system